ncbi:hypothetical protein T261_0302 [Streptomyces lydicus]|nr:hypothetical protein T261_0302 [Streptomyces lydicus]
MTDQGIPRPIRRTLGIGGTKSAEAARGFASFVREVDAAPACLRETEQDGSVARAAASASVRVRELFAVRGSDASIGFGHGKPE